ncbi:MAG: ABC transporter ATP-binding protein [Phycisphaerae bacterium]
MKDLAEPTRSQNDLAIACKGVGKEFRSGDRITVALKDVDIEIPYGEISMLVGPSGSGKTTLISILAGILTPTRGTVRVLGFELHKLSKRQQVRFRRENVGFIFQQFNLLPALTASENAAVPLIAQGMPFAKAVRRAREVLEHLDMARNVDKFPKQLSGGEQQRVAIARALVHEPRLMVCDEPTASLDATTGHRVMELLREIALAADRAVLVVTHDNRIFEFADRIAHMDSGQITDIQINDSVESGEPHV